MGLPPKDYNKWGELVFQWVRHCVERYGQTEVESWYWELWNEPDGFYWMGSPQSPTFEQIQTLEKAGKLEMLDKPKTIKIKDGKVVVSMQLPRQAVSFVKISY